MASNDMYWEICRCVDIQNIHQSIVTFEDVKKIENIIKIGEES